jgi:predicted HAD superfamily phosphohydrolase YqeG
MKHSWDNEWLSGSKIDWYLQCMKGWLGEKIPYRPGEFSRITPEDIRRHFWRRVEWILLDIDDCIAPAYGEILEKNSHKVRELLDVWFQIGILSNGMNLKKRAEVLRYMGVELCTPSVSKPNPQAFVEASQQIGLYPSQVLMVGDDISKDGGALQQHYGNSILAWFIPVNPIWNSLLNIPAKKWLNFGAKKVSRWIANWRNGL